MDAYQARKKTESVLKELERSQIEQVNSVIENAVSKGQFTVNCHFYIREIVLLNFKSLGYKIEKLTSQPNDHEYEISWKDANP
jgi:hypothetical protein